MLSVPLQKIEFVYSFFSLYKADYFKQGTIPDFGLISIKQELIDLEFLK